MGQVVVACGYGGKMSRSDAPRVAAQVMNVLAIRQRPHVLAVEAAHGGGRYTLDPAHPPCLW